MVVTEAENTGQHEEEPSCTLTGYQLVDSSVICLVTRFRMRSLMGIFRAYLWCRRIRSRSAQVDGLIKSLFLMEDLRTFYTISFWSEELAVLRFNEAVPAHIQAANMCFRDLEQTDNGRCLWSAQFSLSAISQFNRNWDGADFDIWIRGGTK